MNILCISSFVYCIELTNQIYFPSLWWGDQDRPGPKHRDCVVCSAQSHVQFLGEFEFICRSSGETLDSA